MLGILPKCVVFSMILALAGCLKDAPPPKEIEIKPAPAAAGIDFIAMTSPLVNPLPDGEPSPVVVRLYQLKGDAAFVNANFRQLWEDDEATLGPTLLGKAEVVLNPGGVERIKTSLIEGTALIAVVVGYRSFEDAKWRAMVPLHGEKNFKLKAEVNALSVNLGPQD